VTPQDRRRAVDEALVDEDATAIVFDGLDAAIVGLGRIQTGDPLVVYSRTGILEALEAQGMDEEDALEWFLYNVQGLYAGSGTPIIMELVEELLEDLEP
jgi:hypothetical protein